MAVNRHSDLGTSLSRTDGTHLRYLNLSSADRNKTVYPDSADCELEFDSQSNVLGMKILNFEIPHTRYAIDDKTSNLYISEKRGQDEYYFYSLRASTGGHSIQNLCASLELSAHCPVIFNGDRAMGNSYTFNTSLLIGKVGIVSSGNYEYTIHAATETVTLSSIAVNSETDATVTFLAPSSQVFKPGALLIFKPHTHADRDVQVVEALSGSTTNEVRVIGDFSDIVSASLDASLSTMVPYSGTNSVAKIMGFGESDLSGQSDFDIIAISSPFSNGNALRTTSVMVTTTYTSFASAGEYVKLSGIPGFLNEAVCRVSIVHDESHLEIEVDRSPLWSYESGAAALTAATDPSAEWHVDGVELASVDNNSVELSITTSSATTLSAQDAVVFTGFHAVELGEVEAEVISAEESSDGLGLVLVRFDYPTAFSFSDGVSSLSPVDKNTSIRTTYISPNRFDLSRGRRMLLCRAIVDNQDVGSIHIPSVSTRSFFGRIQLFSGADLVNFLSKDTAVGSHEFNSVLKRLNKIRFQFLNEDGSAYDFVGVDYTIFLELTCLDSNKGI